MEGLTIENILFILKIEKRNKTIVFDLFQSRDFAYFNNNNIFNEDIIQARRDRRKAEKMEGKWSPSRFCNI